MTPVDASTGVKLCLDILRLMPNTVELLGYYGSDETHALSAWTSTSRDLTDGKRERMTALLHKLASDGHHTPFEKSCLHFLVTCDTATHIHLLKHRVGVSINGESARYKELRDDKFIIPEDWGGIWAARLLDHMEESHRLYHKAIEDLTPTLGRKRAKESARFFLPYAHQITMDISFNFRSFAHFQGLRNKPDAQREVCDVAKQMLWLVVGTGAFNASLEGFGLLPKWVPNDSN